MKEERVALFALVLLVAVPCFARAQPAIHLIDGETLNGWTTVNGDPVAQGWEVVDQTIHLPDGQRGGNIVTAEEYRDFDLQFEWKISKGGNSGIKYRVRKFGNRTLGCEYQILDDSARNVASRESTGSLYEVYEPSSLNQLKPTDQFNHGRIVVWGNHIEHWLNGHRILTAEVGSDEWFERIAASKFADVEGFGQNRSGKIMLTDHGNEVWYRNILLRPLPPPEQTRVARSYACQRPRLVSRVCCRRGLLSRVASRLRGRR